RRRPCRGALTSVPSEVSRRLRAVTLFPYTTLFRSLGHPGDEVDVGLAALLQAHHPVGQRAGGLPAVAGCNPPHHFRQRGVLERRSEEHTSELQSRENLVCRLLPDKKNRVQSVAVVP